MNKLICNIIFLLMSGSLFANEEGAKNPQVDELTQSYQRELLFLSTYKKELKSKISGIEGKLGKKLKMAHANLKALENQWIKKQTDNEILMQKLADTERDYEFKKENKSLIEATLQQARLVQQNKNIKHLEDVPLIQQIDSVLNSSLDTLSLSHKIRSEKGTFYLKNGEEKHGDIIFVGGVARFGRSGSKVAALYPSGGGTFKVWSWLEGESLKLEAGVLPRNLQFFLFENPEKEFVAAKEKTWIEVIQSGGLIGWIIVAMGLVALFMSLIRFLLLKKAECKNPKELDQVIKSIEKDDIEAAQALLLKENNSIHRVVGKTLGFLKTEPQKVDDAIMEGILQESQLIDRFGVFILVIASVAPLMGLLGTVTGMISTFDIITLYGTGNPKLLSGGISEALVTTMLGLIVAIPALLIGQYLGALTENIKTDMEKWALATCNAFKNRGQ